MTDDLEQRRQWAEQVLASLDGIPPTALRMLSRALALARPPFDEFSSPIDCHADSVEYPDVTGELARLQLARALRLVVRHPARQELLEQLNGAEEPPWAALRAAVVDLSETNDEQEEQ